MNQVVPDKVTLVILRYFVDVRLISIKSWGDAPPSSMVETEG